MAAAPIPIITPNPFCPTTDNISTTETAILIGCCGLIVFAIVTAIVFILRNR